MSLEKLRELDAAYWYSEDGGFTYPYRDQDITIPTFVEVLDAFAVAHPKLVFFLDFKCMEAVQPALRIVEERGLEKRVILGSVFPSVNAEVLKYRHPVSPVVADSLTMLYISLLYAIGLLWLYPLKHQVLGGILMKRTRWVMTPKYLKTLRTTGCKIAVFGPDVNSEEDIQYLVDSGVQLIVTDSPNVMKGMTTLLAPQNDQAVSSSN